MNATITPTAPALFTVLVTIESQYGSTAFPAAQHLTWAQVMAEEARVKQEMRNVPGGTLTWKVLTEA